MTPETYPQKVEAWVKTLPSDGPIEPNDVLVWWRWLVMLDQILEGKGYKYRGESFKSEGWATLLVLKLAKEGTPYVVFVTERDHTGCMRAALRMIDEDRLECRVDKFA